MLKDNLVRVAVGLSATIVWASLSGAQQWSQASWSGWARCEISVSGQVQRSADTHVDHERRNADGERGISSPSGDVECGWRRIFAANTGQSDPDGPVGDKRPESERTARGVRSCF